MRKNTLYGIEAVEFFVDLALYEGGGRPPAWFDLKYLFEKFEAGALNVSTAYRAVMDMSMVGLAAAHDPNKGEFVFCMSEKKNGQRFAAELIVTVFYKDRPLVVTVSSGERLQRFLDPETWPEERAKWATTFSEAR